MKLRVPPSEKNFQVINCSPRVYTTLGEQFSYIAITLSETLRIAWKAGLERIRRVTRQPHIIGVSKISKVIDNTKDAVPVMSKRYVLPVEEDEHGECFLTLPDEMLDETGWVEGTLLQWIEETDGSIILRAVEEE